MQILKLFPCKIGNLYIHGSRKMNKIALTFDDGPSKETEKILNILKQHKCKATFFIWGQRIKGKEKIIKRIIKEGHEIGNHSYNHKSLWFKSKKYIKEDILKCDEKLSNLKIKTHLFRVPNGKFGINTLIICKKLKKKIIFCDVVPFDWMMPGSKKIIKNLLKNTGNGSIIDLHDYIEGYGQNKDITQIIKTIIPKLKKKYKLVTISKLLKI